MGKKGKAKGPKVFKPEYEFTKTDMERLGLFQEPGYISIRDPYKASHSFQFRKISEEKPEMFCEASKTRDATMAGYFDRKYRRIMHGECYYDPVALVRRYRMKIKHKNLHGPFIPPHATKLECGKGSFCATIHKCPEHFSPLVRDVPIDEGPTPPNMHTAPPRKGTGYGYVNLTIGKYYESMPENYDAYRQKCLKDMELEKKIIKHICKTDKCPFHRDFYPQPYFNPNPYRLDIKIKPRPKPKVDKNKLKMFKPYDAGHYYPPAPPKLEGGMKAGCFSKFPKYAPNPYGRNVVYPKEVRNKYDKIYFPTSGNKTTVQNSILAQNICRVMNSSNFRTVASPMNYTCAV